MRLNVTVAAIVTLLAGFLEAPYFHLHSDLASEHVRKHHHGHGTAWHSHLSIPALRPHGSPEIEAPQDSADQNAIFLTQASSLTRMFPISDFFGAESGSFKICCVEGEFVWAPAHHAHDPPATTARSPRAPPA